MLFQPTKEEFTLRDMAEFLLEHRPKTIEMTLKHELWYRQLLNPEAMMVQMVTFHGIPIVVTDYE